MRLKGPAMIALLSLGACQSDMMASAPSSTLATPGAPIAFIAIEGPSPDLARKFETVLAQEARKRGFTVVGTTEADKALRVKTYLDAYHSTDGKSGFAWVLDTSENGKTRAARIKGAAATTASAGASWSALDDATMRQIAQMSVEDLVRHMSGAPPVDTALVAEPASE
jgi:hypothetical protein